MADVAILLLAAGASSRMRGADKLLQDVAGVPVLRRQAEVAIAAGAPVFIAAAPERDLRIKALRGLAVTQVPVFDAAEGMGASIRAGVTGLPPGISGVAILPADMPEITTDDVRAVLAAFRATPDVILRGASAQGLPGHPVVFPARLFPALAQLSGDEGARGVLKGETVRLLPLPDQHAVTDLDTPEDWAEWHARQRDK